MLASVAMDKIYSESFWNLFDDLDSSLNPPGPDQLYDIADPYLHAGQRLLDVGCRDARHLIELVRRYDATGIGLDPVPWHVQRALTMVDEAGLAGQIAIRLGVAENLVEPSASIDTIWCRDVIEVLPELPTALAEMRRVLRPGGHLIAYTNILQGAGRPGGDISHPRTSRQCRRQPGRHRTGGRLRRRRLRDQRQTCRRHSVA